MASTSYGFSSEAKPMITGQPRYVAPQISAEEVMKSAIAAVLVEGREHLLSEMEASPQWSSYTDNVSLDWDGSEFVYSLSGDESDISAIRLLEYGGPEAPPVPLLRRVAGRLQEVSKTSLDEAVSGAILGG